MVEVGRGRKICRGLWKLILSCFNGTEINAFSNATDDYEEKYDKKDWNCSVQL